MKNLWQKFLCGILSSLMMVSMMTMTAVHAQESTYNENGENTEEGQTPYIVDFSDTENILSGAVDATTVTATSDVLTFSGKEKAAASYYGVQLTEFPIIDHIYTITYWIECTDIKDRVAFQPFWAGNGRIGWTTTNNGKTDTMQFITNGTIDVNTSVTMVRDVDTENNNRQHFKIVVDGVNYIMRLYILCGGKYEFAGETTFTTSGKNFKDHLRPTMYSYDTLTNNEQISLGEVTIEKGDTIGLSAEANKRLESENYVLLDEVDFSSSAYNWGKINNLPNNGQTVSNGGKTLTLNAYGARMMGYLPIENQWISGGSYTVEMFITAEGATDKTAFYAVGLPSNRDTMFGFEFFGGTDGKFINSFNYGTSKATANATKYGVTLTEYNVDVIPDMTDPTKPNVRIEYDVPNRQIVCYELSKGAFVKTASIAIAANKLTMYACLGFAHYNSATTATFSNVKIYKGLLSETEHVEKVGFTSIKGIQTLLIPVDGKTSVRLIGALDSTEFSKVGCLITAVYKSADGAIRQSTVVVDKWVTVVYDSVSENVGGKVTAKDLGASYLYAITVTDVPADENVQVDFIVTPYTVGIGETEKVLGETVTVSVINGKYIKNATSLTVSAD